ncbi:uncharacterized protein N7496_010201 [Penicillium cataractarum]|uniref:Major facilitator superfamily (MFS) profile domain-containing protein n=1 Tax=Penicillium cataractarum TaxID=2100454 RepID=A0A9W9RQD1_9EURO|nr:uncharacterized protein N7496_010201 [Penicillium cataractarum]KAJ5364488.1 hypothetical protein N7496_010201 [Penicillium cataractarum]
MGSLPASRRNPFDNKGSDKGDIVGLLNTVAQMLTRLEDDIRTTEILLVSWNDPNDPSNPYNWPIRRKWTLTFMSALITFLTMMNGTIMTVAHDAVSQHFNISDASFPNTYWPVTSWTIGGGLFALFILPLMEGFGVRWAFIGSYIAFFCFVIPQAIAQNFATLIVTRFFAGGFSAIVANTCVALVGNIWETERARTIPVSLYIVSYLSGRSMGPVVGDSIFQFLSWRWIGYLQLIWFGALLPIYIVMFRECRGSTILQERAKSLRLQGKNAYTQHEIDKARNQTTFASIIMQSATRPLSLLVREPVAFIFTAWSAFTIGLLYLFTQSVEQVFIGLYGWTPCQAGYVQAGYVQAGYVQAGYVQAAIVVGELIGWAGTLLSARFYFASASRNTEVPGAPIPEARLYMALVGGMVGISGGMFVYARTSFSFLPWICLAIGLAMVGAGSIVVVTGISDYAVDAYSKYAGSVIAIIAMGENTFAGTLPLATMKMYSSLGNQWASTTLACIASAFSIVPIIVFVWGREIRARSPFMRASMTKK